VAAPYDDPGCPSNCGQICMTALFLILSWTLGAAIGIFLISLAVRLGIGPAINELRLIRVLLEDLHDEHSLDPEMTSNER
jgi:hypothetical protein